MAKSKEIPVTSLNDPRLPVRFWRKVSVADSGCWEWTAGQLRGGYARFRVGGRGSKSGVAHRFAYETLVGKIPDGRQLDHLCRVRHCVNPANLEPVTPRENTLRGETPAAANAAKTHCPAGHEYTVSNTYLDKPRGIRMCRLCGRDRMRKIRAKKGK